VSGGGGEAALGEDGLDAGDLAAEGAKLAGFLQLAGLLLHAKVKLILLDVPAAAVQFVRGHFADFFDFHGA
jgi:hypothetical protein